MYAPLALLELSVQMLSDDSAGLKKSQKLRKLVIYSFKFGDEQKEERIRE